MILVLGGTKSGKSSWASNQAIRRESAGLGPVSYLATARAGDDEMAYRIRRHQEDRPDSWTTVEEPEKPYRYFDSLAAQDIDEQNATDDRPSVQTTELPMAATTVLLDCVTLWLTNLLAPMGEKPDRKYAFQVAEKETERLVSAIARWESGNTALNRQAYLVSNLVETGLVSPWPLGRIFQDIAGLTHQKLAAASDEVYVLTAGIPQRIK